MSTIRLYTAQSLRALANRLDPPPPSPTAVLAAMHADRHHPLRIAIDQAGARAAHPSAWRGKPGPQ